MFKFQILNSAVITAERCHSPSVWSWEVRPDLPYYPRPPSLASCSTLHSVQSLSANLQGGTWPWPSLPPGSVTSCIQWQLSKPGNDWDHRHATTSSPPPTPSSAKNRPSSLRCGSGVNGLLQDGTYIVTRMYLTLNGTDNCTAIAPHPCNGRPMLLCGLKVVVLIIMSSSTT